MHNIETLEEFSENANLADVFQLYVDINEAKSSFYSRGNPNDEEIKNAVLNRNYVGIYYEEKETGVVKSGFRLIEPYAFGKGFVSNIGAVSHVDRKYLRAFVIMDTEKDDLTKDKLNRKSVSKTKRTPFWRLFRIDRISSWFTFKKKFSRYRSSYNPDDKMMNDIIASSKYKDFPYGQVNENKKIGFIESSGSIIDGIMAQAKMECRNLECDGMTRVLDYLLTNADIAHTVMSGEACIDNRCLLHYWITINGMILDLKSKMWFGEKAAEGLFYEKDGIVSYDGEPIDIHTSELIYKILING